MESGTYIMCMTSTKVMIVRAKLFSLSMLCSPWHPPLTKHRDNIFRWFFGQLLHPWKGIQNIEMFHFSFFLSQCSGTLFCDYSCAHVRTCGEGFAQCSSGWYIGPCSTTTTTWWHYGIIGMGPQRRGKIYSWAFQFGPFTIEVALN